MKIYVNNKIKGIIKYGIKLGILTLLLFNAILANELD
jgi:hypothetical protein